MLGSAWHSAESLLRCFRGGMSGQWGPGAGDAAAKGSGGAPQPMPGGLTFSILNKEQLCKHDSGQGKGGGKDRGAEAREEVANKSPERLHGEEQLKPASRMI